MDTKSLAKSRRAHSLLHKKHHPNQKAKGATSSVAPTSTDKAPGKAVKEKARVRPAALASNWDHYEDEDDPMTEDQVDGQTSQPSDVVVPKSKGADYAYLISEAKSQNSTRFSSEIFPSLDDFVSDFGHGKESFFAVRGEILLSSIQNDSFFVEDKTPANYEASFLSLNMHALAKQLTKIDLPKRLFMEADLFPPKQQHAEKVQERQAHDHHEVTSTTTTTTTTSSSTKSSIRMSPAVHHPTPHLNPKSVASSSANPSKLKAETAETELDMLLDSFDDVNLKEKASSTLTSKKHTLDFDIDGTLDDLLKETSTPFVLDQNIASQSQHVSKSEPFDDFDSWLDTI
ncbi:hypothetical protein L1987_37916 [Smallanthus sonchifolius]|uniref:Uncharacterized protein n=1 Tax=Smallanthus sonchifolius TaxID=185202 RepID=A0ACB9HJ41_9ASTR|nr:hypothetical protein L1987_37916 [Smallanthus sonchifolius]